MKIGIISFAHLHAESYASILNSAENVEFIGIWDNNSQRAEEAAKRFKVPHLKTVQNFFNSRPNAVIICSENSRHKDFAIMAAEHGCAVLCEKPLATSPEDAAFIVNLFQEKELLLMTAFPMRYSAPVKEARNIVRSGQLGQIYSISSVNQGKLPQDGLGWFVNKELAGGGALTDHLVHLCDIFYWILDKEVVEVYACSNNNLHSEKNLEVETGALVMLKFKEGPFVSIDCSWSRPEGYPTWGGLAFEIIGEKGTMKVDAFKQTSELYFRKDKPRWDYWGSDADKLMIENFITSLREKRKPLVSGEDGLKAVKVVAAAYRSVEQARPVRPSKFGIGENHNG